MNTLRGGMAYMLGKLALIIDKIVIKNSAKRTLRGENKPKPEQQQHH